MKRPAFQFYPGDWVRDTSLRRVSPPARALWIDLICLMHDGEPYGHLRSGGSDIEPHEIARATGMTLSEVRRGLGELERAGVFSRTAGGTIFSRRMVRDERVRTVRASSGRLGGNPTLLKQNANQEPRDTVNQSDNQKPTPAVCSLQSATDSQPATQQPVESLFPPSARKLHEQREGGRSAPRPPQRSSAGQSAAVHAWGEACAWVREHARSPLQGGDPYYAGEAMPDARADFALRSVGGDRLLMALTRQPRELGFARRDFLQAWSAWVAGSRAAAARDNAAGIAAAAAAGGGA